jgi:hypothetical protein
MTWCVKRRDEYGNRHDEPTGYTPPGHMCIHETGVNFRSLCCSDGMSVYCITHDGAETYCTEESRPEFVKRFISTYNELISRKGWERRGDTIISAFKRY